MAYHFSQLEAVLLADPECNGVLVRRHGFFVWGDSWQQAKIRCECFQQLFETAVLGRILNINFSTQPETGTTPTLAVVCVLFSVGPALTSLRLCARSRARVTARQTASATAPRLTT